MAYRHKDRYTCKHCLQNFSAKTNVYRHIRNVHSEVHNKESNKIECVKCEYRGRRLDQLLEHVKEVHHVKLDIVKLEFDNNLDFLFWKGEQEKITMSVYAQKTSAKTIGENKYFYYYCNKSGYIAVHEGHRKKPRVSAKAKTKAYCIAYIKAIVEGDGKVKVEFCQTHFGHDEVCSKKINEKKKEHLDKSSIKSTKSK
ncbi:uncharacterized protein [Antedon mediterranea]|uniref:uncharacterized protein n=1 Tax=Antedon mediterranea TaxID=105859 RepID=UPI003AF8A0F3